MQFARLELIGTDIELTLIPGDRRIVGGGDPEDVDLHVDIMGGQFIEIHYDGASVCLTSNEAILENAEGTETDQLILEPGQEFKALGLPFRFELTSQAPTISDDLRPLLVEIPDMLHSAELNGPFETCQMCGYRLLTGEEDRPYLVHKVKKPHDVVFEFALCLTCAGKLVSEYSLESRRRFESYLREKILPKPVTSEACRICGRPVEECGELNISGHCVGDLHIPGTILLICFDCADEMNALASKQTRDRYQEFVDDCFPGVPAGVDSFEPMMF